MILPVTDDFDLDRIAQSGQCFRWEKTGEGSFRIPYRGVCLNISALGEGCFALDCDQEEFDTLWREYFDLNENYAALRALLSESCGEARLDRQGRPFFAFPSPAGGETRRGVVPPGYDLIPLSHSLRQDCSRTANCTAGWKQ